MRFEKYPGWVCLAVGLLALAVRLAWLPLLPIPEPTIHDEFSYVLGGETLHLGRLTNPPHPLWQHFETFHEIFQPTYASKYPPAQALFLALGWTLFGHPWYGVLLSSGFLCAALCWMLQGWMPPRYALLGALLALVQWGITGYWINSYWGGAVAAAAGALVIGAVPRLVRHPTTPVAAAGALGALLLANSRPYEGAVTVAGALLVLLVWRRLVHHPLRGLLSRAVIVPAAAILLAGVAWMGFYNYRVTGKALEMPYSVYQKEYVASPVFWLQSLPPEPVYRHEELRLFFTGWDKQIYEDAHKRPHRAAWIFLRMLQFFLTPMAAAAAILAVLLRRSRKVAMAVAILAFPVFGQVMERYSLPHYFAPATGLLLILVMLGVQYARVRYGKLAVAVLMALMFAGIGLRVIQKQFEFNRTEFAAARRQTLDFLARQGGQQLVIVRYTPDHNLHDEWVFNDAEIDRSQIVWARDMGAARNQELLDYYRGRKVWYLQLPPPPGQPAIPSSEPPPAFASPTNASNSTGRAH